MLPSSSSRASPATAEELQPRIASSSAGHRGLVSVGFKGHAHQTLHLLLIQGVWSPLRHCATGGLRAEVRRGRDEGELVTRAQGQLMLLLSIAIFSAACRSGGGDGGRSATGARMRRSGGSTRVIHHYRDGGTNIGRRSRPERWGLFFPVSVPSFGGRR